MQSRTPSRQSGTSIDDVARGLAPHLQILSGSQPTPLLREHNVVALAKDAESARRAVLALESIEHSDDQLGTVVMGTALGDGGAPRQPDDGNGRVDPEGVGRQIFPRVLLGGAVGALVGAVVIGGGALAFGADGGQLVGAAVAGAMLLGVFGAIWFTFAGLGGSDAYRQTFVDDASVELTIVSVHTDDRGEAAKALERLAADPALQVFTLDRSGQTTAGYSDPADPNQTDDEADDLDEQLGSGDAVPGDPAPSFVTAASTGSTLALEDFVGKVPIMLTFVGTLPTEDAEALVAAFDDAFVEFGRRQVQLMIVLPESAAAVRSQREQGTTVPLLADDNGVLVSRFASSAVFPVTVVIDKAGTVTRVLEGGNAHDHVTAVRGVSA